MRLRTGAVVLLPVLSSASLAVIGTSAPTSAAPSTVIGQSGEASTFNVKGVPVPGTPAKYDKVEVRRFGSPKATNVLVLVPGTQAGAADFDVVGPYLAATVPNLQVWAENRREGALENNSMLLSVLNGTATAQDAFNYYLGWLTNPAITTHYQPLQASKYGFVDQWGMATAMGDLHNVIELARDGGKRTVVLGGHSLGGAEASIYPAWDFNGQGGYQDIAGIVGIDGDAGLPSGFGSAPITTAAEATTALTNLEAGSPWLDLLGVGLPWVTGAFAEVGALAALEEPDSPSILQASGLLPADLNSPVSVTNLAGLGYDFDASTSPASLALIHVHSGYLDTSSSPAGWIDNGPTPVENVADVFAQEPIGAVDWYYPERLTIDAEAAGSLTQTPAATVLGLSLTHLAQVDVPMYAIQTSLGGGSDYPPGAVIAAAQAYQSESQIPSLTTVDESATYSHLDPLLAAPSQNDFLQTIVPWIEQLSAYRPVTVAKVLPTSGPGGGGTKVTIDGSALEGASAVMFGGVAATSFTVNGAGTKITAYAPAEAAGTADVTVTVDGVTSAISAADEYKFLGPTITKIKPAQGPAGATVVISGKNLGGAGAVEFGGLPATIVSVNAGGTTITALAPTGGAGTLNIAVTTPGGISPAVAADEFTYT